MNFISQISVKGWITIAIIVVLLILIIYWLTKKPTVTTTTTTTAANPIVAATSPARDDSFPLSYGSRGENVKVYQLYLNKKGAKLVVDGIWGPKTEAASLLYEKFNSIPKQYFDTVIKA